MATPHRSAKAWTGTGGGGGGARLLVKRGQAADRGRTVDSLADSWATLELMGPVTAVDALGLPSACAPAGSVDGLPVGALLTGPM